VVTGKQTFDLSKLATLAPSPAMQFGLFFVFALAFAIKTPLFPFHSWLPDAYSAAPIPMLITFAGLALRMPVMAGVFAVVTLAALGLPGLNSFVGEFMTLLGAWQRAPLLAVFGAIGLVLAPVYMLRLFQGVTQGAPMGPVPKSDIRAAQVLVLAPLIAVMFAIGWYPNALTQLMTSL